MTPRLLVLILCLLPTVAGAQWSGTWGRDIDTRGGRVTQQQVGAAWQFTLQVTDPRFAILRNERFRRGVASIGGTYTYEFAQYVPNDFARSPLFVETAQFLPQGQWNTNAPWAWFGPVLAVGIQNGHWILTNSQHVNGREVMHRRDLGTVGRNQWTPFRVEVKWSPNSDGWIRVYKDARLVFQRQGPSTFAREVPYFKTGLYTRRGWTQGTRSSPLHRFRILHAGLTVRQGAGGSPPVAPPTVTPGPPGDPAPAPPSVPTLPGADPTPDPDEVTPPAAPVVPPVQIPALPLMPTLPPPTLPPPVVVRPPQPPPAYTAGTGGA